jgi:hypothetical protein
LQARKGFIQVKLNYTPLFKPKTMAVAGVSSSNDRHPANVIYHELLFCSNRQCVAADARIMLTGR